MTSKKETERLKEKYGERVWLDMEAKRIREYREKNKDKVRALNKAWNKKNRNEYQRKYRLKQKSIMLYKPVVIASITKQ